jgi:hypothetical protein
MNRRIWALAAAAVGALAVAVAGCGGGSDDPTKVAVNVTENGKGDYTISVPSEIKGGAVELALDNSGGQAPHSAQLIQLGEGHTFEEASSIINSNRPVPIPDWIRGYGGVGAVDPGRTGTATVQLDEGHYAIQDDAENGAKEPPYAEFDVKEANDADLPETDATVVAATTGQNDPEYEWQVDGLKAGANTLTFESQGDEALHHIVALPIKGNATIDQVGQELNSQTSGPPKTVDITTNIGTAVIDGGKSEVTTLNLQPGRYAFVCFLPDRDEPNKPHVRTGLLKEVTVPST